MAEPTIRFEEHRGKPNGTIDSRMVYNRPIEPILAELREYVTLLVEEHIIVPGTQLPEVQVLRDIRSKGAEIHNARCRRYSSTVRN